MPAFDPVNPRERRKSLFDAFEQRGDERFLAPNTQQNALAVIEDFAGKAQLVRDAPDSRTKADTLYASAHAKLDRPQWSRKGRHNATVVRRTLTCR